MFPRKKNVKLSKIKIIVLITKHLSNDTQLNLDAILRKPIYIIVSMSQCSHAHEQCSIRIC